MTMIKHTLYSAWDKFFFYKWMFYTSINMRVCNNFNKLERNTDATRGTLYYSKHWPLEMSNGIWVWLDISIVI